MDPKIYRFFSKNGFQETDIKYIVRENKKTNIYLINGRVVETYTPLKAILPSIDQHVFQNINKGIAVNTDCVSRIEDGIYLMKDGREFRGRVRMSADQRQEQARRIHEVDGKWSREQVLQSLILFQDMPVGFCLMENDPERGLLVRFCNKKMETLFDMMPHEWHGQKANSSMFPVSGRWLEIAEDVAKNGGMKTEKTELNGQTREMVCYQPYPDYCAFMIVDKQGNLR